MRLRIMLLCCCIPVVAVAETAFGLEVAICVKEPTGAARTRGVVTTGVPFAKGAVKDVSNLSVTVGGKVIPAQFLKLVPWSDGSVRWALMDTQVDVSAGGKTELVVRDNNENRTPEQPVKISDSADMITVSTGPMTFAINKKKANLFGSFKIDGKELINSAGRGLVIYTEDGKEAVAGPPAEVQIEQAGTMRATVCVRGKFSDVHNDLLGYTVRITAYAGAKIVKVHVWLENNDAHGYSSNARRMPEVRPKYGWFTFDGMAVEFGLGLGSDMTATCEGVQTTGKITVEQRCLGRLEPAIFQGKPVKSHPVQNGFRWKDFVYKITAAGKELKKGKRTDGVLALAGANGKLTVAIRHFWQNYNKTVEADGASLKLWLWPRDGQWPRSYGIRKWALASAGMWKLFGKKPSFYQFAGAMHKGHEFILDFSGHDPRQSGAEISSPLMAMASPTYIATTEAAPGLFAPANEVKSHDMELTVKLRAWNRLATNTVDANCKTSITQASRHGIEDYFGWYGWMDFGDVFNYASSLQLQDDWPEIMLTNYLRTGDRRFFNMAVGMHRHRTEVDQCWSDRDLPQYRYLQRRKANQLAECHRRGAFHFGAMTLHSFGRTAPPTLEKTWTSGIAFYYMLTGDRKALECCLRTYRGIKELLIDAKEADLVKRYADTLFLVTARSITSLCALHDITGEKKYLSEAMGLFRKHVLPRLKKGPHLTPLVEGGRIPKDGGKQYCNSIISLCRLHHRTGDADLLKVLVTGVKEDFTLPYYQAPLYLAGLHAYVGYKTRAEMHMDSAVELFLERFPPSQNPPVVINGDINWSERASLLLRSGYLLQYARWKLESAGGK